MQARRVQAWTGGQWGGRETGAQLSESSGTARCEILGFGLKCLFLYHDEVVAGTGWSSSASTQRWPAIEAFQKYKP